MVSFRGLLASWIAIRLPTRCEKAMFTFAQLKCPHLFYFHLRVNADSITQVFSALWTSPKLWKFLHCLGKCLESLLNLLNVLNILNIIKMLSLLNLLKAPKIMEALNMLNSKNENKVSPKKGPQLLEPEPQEIGNFFQDSKMIKDAPAEAAIPFPIDFNFDQYLTEKCTSPPSIVFNLTKTARLPKLILIAKGSRITKKLRSSKVKHHIKFIEVSRTRKLCRSTKVSKVIRLSRSSTKFTKLRKLTKLTEQTKLTKNQL